MLITPECLNGFQLRIAFDDQQYASMELFIPGVLRKRIRLDIPESREITKQDVVDALQKALDQLPASSV